MCSPFDHSIGRPRASRTSWAKTCPLGLCWAQSQLRDTKNAREVVLALPQGHRKPAWWAGEEYFPFLSGSFDSYDTAEGGAGGLADYNPALLRSAKVEVKSMFPDWTCQQASQGTTSPASTFTLKTSVDLVLSYRIWWFFKNVF